MSMEGYEVGYILGFHRKYEVQPGESIWEKGIIFRGNVPKKVLSIEWIGTGQLMKNKKRNLARCSRHSWLQI